MGFNQQPYIATYSTTTTCHHGKGDRWWYMIAGNSIISRINEKTLINTLRLAILLTSYKLEHATTIDKDLVHKNRTTTHCHQGNGGWWRWWSSENGRSRFLIRINQTNIKR